MKYLDTLLELLYPRDMKCAVCGREAATVCGVCDDCAEKLIPSAGRETPFYLCAFTSALFYDEQIRNVIHRFKYGNEPHLAYFLAGRIQIPDEWDIDALIPVPLHPKRLRERGYNQSELLAKELSRSIGLPVETTLLKRVRETATQTEFTEEQRLRNVEGAFLAAKKCENKRLLLIDDVCTTGSTLSACAKALRQAGASAVYGASVASVGISGGKTL